MTSLVAYMVLFVTVAFVFVFIHLMIGKLIRPAKPDAEKLTIYECGEPTIGSAWVQFDLRFYVVALLFVIFDVEVAFFFPWAVVFGHANTVAHPAAADPQRIAQAKKELLRQADDVEITEDESKAAKELAWIAFWDILVFFGVLLVGFAYLWKRGDLDWVRSLAAERAGAVPVNGASAPSPAPALVGAGKETW